MGNHAGHFAFSTRGLDHSAIDVHRAARQRERIDVAGIDDLEVKTEFRMLKLRWNRGHQTLADSFDIGVNLRIAQQRELLFCFGSRLPSKLDVVRRAEFVAVISDLSLGESHDGHRNAIY